MVGLVLVCPRNTTLGFHATFGSAFWKLSVALLLVRRIVTLFERVENAVLRILVLLDLCLLLSLVLALTTPNRR